MRVKDKRRQLAGVQAFVWGLGLGAIDVSHLNTLVAMIRRVSRSWEGTESKIHEPVRLNG